MRIHRNLHAARKGAPQWCETVKGRVARRLPELVLLDVTTRIQPAGAAKCRVEGVRRVCAFLDGTEAPPVMQAAIGEGFPFESNGWTRLAYDPREDLAFMAEGEAWTSAEAVALLPNGSAWILNPTARQGGTA